MIRKILFLTFILMLLMGTASAQEGAVDIRTVNDDDFPTVELTVAVTDENGQAVTDLTADDFSLDLALTPQTIISVENITSNELPISVVLVIDTSTSMTGKPLEDTKAAALTFVDRLVEGDEVSVVTFDSDVQVVQEFTEDLDAVRDAMTGLAADGRTALYDAGLRAGEVAASANTPRRFVVFLSDGNEFGGLSANPAEAGVTFAQDNRIPLYTIGLGFGVDETYLSDLANASGGEFYLYPSSDRLGEIYDFLGSYLRTLYIVRAETNVEPDGNTVSGFLRTPVGNSIFDYTTVDLYPQIALNGLDDAAEITEPITVDIQIDAPRGLESVDVTLNGEATDAGEITEDLAAGQFSQTFIVNPADTAPGTYTLAVSAADSEGGQREATGEYSVAALPPSFTIEGLAEGGNIESAAYDISIDASESQSPPESVEIIIDDETAATLTEAPFDATIDALGIGDGDHTLEVVVTSESGASASQSIGFSVDPSVTAVPEFSIVGLADGDIIDTPELRFSVDADPSVTLDVTLDGAALIPAEDGDYVVDVIAFMEDGEHVVDVTATGANGVSASESVVFDVDAALFAPPSFTIDGLSDGDVVSDPVLEFSITSDDPDLSASVSLNGESLEADENGLYSVDVLALEGDEHTVDVAATGGNGITTLQSLGFTVDPALIAAPEFSISGLGDGDVLENPVLEFSIEGISESDSVTVLIDGDSVDAADDGGYEIDLLELGEGEHTLFVEVTGENGVSASESLTFAPSGDLFVQPTEVASTTPQPTDEPTEAPTDTPVPTETPEPTDEPTEGPTNTPAPTDTLAPTDTPEPTATPTDVPTTDVEIGGEDDGGDNNSLLPVAGVILLLIIAVVLWFLFGRRGKNEDS